MIELIYVEVLPGLVLALLPDEDPAVIAAALSAHFDETERRPGMDWPLTEDEYLAMLEDEPLDEWEGW